MMSERKKKARGGKRGEEGRKLLKSSEKREKIVHKFRNQSSSYKNMEETKT